MMMMMMMAMVVVVMVCGGARAYLVTRAHPVATPEAVALEVKAAFVAAPALVSVLGGHVGGVPYVAVSQAHLETTRKQKKQGETERKKERKRKKKKKERKKRRSASCYVKKQQLSVRYQVCSATW